jgi:hypothetical protein
MRRFPFVAAISLAVLGLGACADKAETPAAAHPNLIIVRDFAAPLGVVTLDPSFGFSLRRGEAGVPSTQRGASVARAAVFTLADTVVEQLRAYGYDAVRSNEAGPEPGGRALVVNGAFRSINEGYRRRVGAEGSNVAVDAEIEFQGQGAAPRRLMAFQLDSRQVPREGTEGVSARREPINAAVGRVGAYIARAVLELARHSNWPGAPR